MVFDQFIKRNYLHGLRAHLRKVSLEPRRTQESFLEIFRRGL